MKVYGEKPLFFFVFVGIYVCEPLFFQVVQL